MKNDEKGEAEALIFVIVLGLVVWLFYSIYDQTNETHDMVERIVQGRANIPCKSEPVIHIEDYELFEEILERFYEKEAKEI